MNTVSFDSSIWPWIKKVGTANFVSGVQSEVLNPIYFSSSIEDERTGFLTIIYFRTFYDFFCIM